jgi:hypothetical protein
MACPTHPHPQRRSTSAADGFHPPFGSNDERRRTSLSARVQIVKSSQLSADTAQTDGMRRMAAISGKSVGSESIWAGSPDAPDDPAGWPRR